MQFKCQTIVIGLGQDGREVIRQFRTQFDPSGPAVEFSARPDRSDLALISFADDPSEMTATIKDSEEHQFFATDKTQLLSSIDSAFEYLLKQRPVRDFSFTYYLDVFIVGSWRDAEYLRLLHYALICIERTVRIRYGSIFSQIEERINSRIHVHPFAMSNNLPCEDAREEIALVLAKVNMWNKLLRSEKRDVVPRFFLFDGFTNNIQLAREELTAITSNFIGMCIRSGLRAQTEFRRLLNFSDYGEDFFAIFSLATLYFPRLFLTKHAIDYTVQKFYQMLHTAHGEPGKLAQQQTIESRFDIDRIEQIALPVWNLNGKLFWETVMSEMQEYNFIPDPEQPPILDRIDDLIKAGVTFPENARSIPSETLDSFLDERWLEHLAIACFPESDRGVHRLFLGNVDSDTDARVEKVQEMLQTLDAELRSVLGLGGANFSLDTFCASLRQVDWAKIQGTRNRLIEKQDKLDLRRWSFGSITPIWARMRAELWRRIPRHIHFTWIPTISIVLGLLGSFSLRAFLSGIEKDAPIHDVVAPVLDSWYFLPGVMLLCSAVMSIFWAVVSRYRNACFEQFMANEETDDSEQSAFGKYEASRRFGILDFPAGTGIIKSIGLQMANRATDWWEGQLELARLSLCNTLVYVASRELRKLRIYAEKVLEYIEARSYSTNDQEEIELPHSHYFSDMLRPGRNLEDFFEHTNRHSSLRLTLQSMANRLSSNGIREFLDSALNEEDIKKAAAAEYPFFHDGDIFASPQFAEDVSHSFKRFMLGLPDRLSHGQIFHYFSSKEDDKLIEQTDIIVVLPAAAQHHIKTLEGWQYEDLNVMTSEDPDHCWGLRTIRDISLRSVLKYMSREEDEEVMDEENIITSLKRENFPIYEPENKKIRMWAEVSCNKDEV
jgi:hypothetical protein